MTTADRSGLINLAAIWRSTVGVADRGFLYGPKSLAVPANREPDRLGGVVPLRTSSAVSAAIPILTPARPRHSCVLTPRRSGRMPQRQETMRAIGATNPEDGLAPSLKPDDPPRAAPRPHSTMRFIRIH
jgi:hypothetical protein